MNQTLLQQESHQRNKYIASTPGKILESILKMYQEGIHSKRPKNKEIVNYAKSVTSKWWQRYIVCVKKKKEVED